MKRWATDHGWTYRDRAEYAAQVVAQEWRYWDGRPVFPLLYPRDSPTLNSWDHGVTKFPRHMAGDLIVLLFETGWMREAPGSGDMTPAFGYAVLGEAGKKLASTTSGATADAVVKPHPASEGSGPYSNPASLKILSFSSANFFIASAVGISPSTAIPTYLCVAASNSL